jgi:hypothetical protein
MGGLEFGKFIEILDGHPNIYLDTSYSFWPSMPFTFNLGSDFPNVILPREGEINYLLFLFAIKDCLFTVG